MYVKATYNWWKGEGYFSDPLGKPSLFGFFVDYLKFLGGTAFLIMKPATEDAINAAKNPVTPGSDDGVQARCERMEGRNLIGRVAIWSLVGSFFLPSSTLGSGREAERRGAAVIVCTFRMGQSKGLRVSLRA